MKDEEKKALVSAVRLSDYTPQEEVGRALEQVLQPLGGMAAFVKPGQKVLLKPNLVAPSAPELAVTTHPALVRAVIRQVKSAGGICFLGDGPGVGGTLTAAKASGLLEVAETEGAQFVVFEETAVFENNDNRILKHIELTKHLKEMDVLITLPKLKTHCQMAYTGALKNQYGLIPGAAKGKFHFRFQNRDRLADFMIDINRTAAPALAIMDAVVGMEGPGPSGGTPRKIGLLLASSDLSALDTIAFSIIGLTLPQVPVSLAAQRGNFGTVELEKIELAGPPLDELRIKDFDLVRAPLNIMRILPLPRFMLRWIRRQVAPAPRINPKVCIKCRRCEHGCPVSPPAIQPIVEGGPRVNDGTCIRCYCCHEFCPVKAIELKKSLLARCINFDALSRAGSRLLGSIAAVFRR